jgi:DNA-binding CsgD family transcriptional regulator/tetratricopeptide (TPR) repeat protein/energy-coupling factor transporter ATP-binding protein EcfA2
MTARPLVCPVLVGRDEQLALADRRIAEVGAGRGQFLLIGGESGVGKTRLLAAIEGLAIATGFRSVRGGTYPSDLRVGGAVLLDLGRSMLRSTDGVVEADGRALLATLEALALTWADAGREEGDPGGGEAEPGRPGPDGDAHRRRRLLILDAVDALADLGRAGPTLIQLEDLHWSDDLTLEIIEAFAGRLRDQPILLIGTYRSDELYPRVPTREWRARLAARRQAEVVTLPRLDRDQTSTMASILLGSALPVPRDLMDAIQDRSDGIPLHVEELIALMATVGGPGDPSAGTSAGPADVPTTVEDAIAARLAARSTEAITVAEAGAVIGRSFDLDLLAAVMGRSLDELSDAIGELGDHFILLPARMPGRYGFRHALLCDSIYARIPEPRRRQLHARTADAASTRRDVGGRPFLAMQLERAGRTDEAFEVARAAAQAATALSSHHEARDLYEMGLRTAPPGLPAAERGALEEAFAGAAAATDDNVTADAAYVRARVGYLAAGRPVEAAAVLAPHVAVRHLLGDDLQARVDRLSVGLAELESLAPGPDGPSSSVDRARARLQAAMSAAYMLDRRLDEAIAYGTAAEQAAESAGATAVARNAATTLGSCFVFAGRMDEGWSRLGAIIAAATSAHLEAEAARAYRMLGSSASVLVEYDRAERSLRQGIEYAELVELWNDRHYMAAHLAHVLWATGRWDAALDVARQALADGRGGITTRITALTVLGYVELGRGRLDESRTHLEEARDLAEGMRELQRLSPALWGLAEIALGEDAPAAAVSLSDRAVALSEAVGDAAYLFPFAVTGTRAYLALGEPARAGGWLARVDDLVGRRAIPGTLPALDHARGLLATADGTTAIARTHLVAAVAGWTERGRAWEGAWARIDLAVCQLRSNQRAEAVRAAASARAVGVNLGSPAVVAAADAILGPRRRGGDDPPWAPLTAREFEVARRIARGWTNPEIAEDLGITRKTVSAHVEHILAKLGVDRRAEVAAWVAGNRVLHSGPHGDDREE